MGASGSFKCILGLFAIKRGIWALPQIFCPPPLHWVHSSDAIKDKVQLQQDDAYPLFKYYYRCLFSDSYFLKYLPHIYCCCRSYHPSWNSIFIPQHLWPFFYYSCHCFCQIPGFCPRVQIKVNKHPTCIEFLYHFAASAMFSMFPITN